MRRFVIWKKSGFTLIELLIVIAIILILIAIALPNFLEAQIRAKVSRTNSDLRAYEIALESYNVDYKRYPWPMCCKNPGSRPGRNGWPDVSHCWQTVNLLEITTPHKYIGSVNRQDIFSTDEGAANGLWLNNGYYTYQPYMLGGWFLNNLDNATAKRLQREAWCLLAWGPSQHHPTTASGQVIPVHFPDWGPSTRSGLGWGDIVYSPTNGTVSNGIIYRCGGSLQGWFSGNGKYAMSPRMGN
jgi:prepilin-type N-terminal cleavage/methylation domain-containing protein